MEKVKPGNLHTIDKSIEPSKIIVDYFKRVTADY